MLGVSGLSQGVDFEALRKKFDDEWESKGLKDESLRISYAATLTQNQQEKLLVSAAATNIQLKRLLDRGGVFVKPMLKRNDERFLSLLNAGLEVNKSILVDDKKINLLNQAIQTNDLGRITLLLAAGAKPLVDAKNMKNDSFAIAAHSGDLMSMALLLSYTKEPLPKEEYWLIGLLHSTQEPVDYIMGELMARRSEQLGDNYEELMKKSIDSCKKKLEEDNFRCIEK